MLRDGKSCGELVVEREGLYVRFTARGKLPDSSLWCAWMVGERGELRLGVLEPEGERGAVCRRFSAREAESRGRILRCELRRAGEEPVVWTAVGNPGELFCVQWLKDRLMGAEGALTCRKDGRRLLALPWDKRRPFPLVPLFCLGRLQCIGSRYYIVYSFGENDRPVPAEEKNCKK